MRLEEIKNLSFDELRVKYKKYMLAKGLSANTTNTAYSDTFYIWKKGSSELFWNVVLSKDFEKDAKDKVFELLNEHSKANPNNNASSYISHLRRFLKFVEELIEGESYDFVELKSEPIKRKVTVANKYEETIIIERMYAGGYLGENIGHEIINTFKTDSGENYIYISPWGIINSKYQNTKAVLLVRLINEHCYEIIGYASNLFLLLSQEAMLNAKRAGQVEDERQRKIILENGISYGGLAINEILSEQHNTVFVTFKAETYRNIKPEKQIYIVDNEDYVFNESYILVPDFRFSNQSLKLYAPKNERARAFDVLDNIIKKTEYWEPENNAHMISEIKGTDSTFGILDIIGKNDDELVYSNWIGYYLKNHSRLMECFASKVLKIKLDGEKTDVKREYHSIDLWLEDDNNIVVIENKIKSGINGIDSERHDLKSEMIQSQLSKYYSFAESEAIKNKKQPHYYLFMPDYSYKDEDLSVYLMSDKYVVIRYSKISEFFDGLERSFHIWKNSGRL